MEILLDLENLEADLTERAFLYDDPATYREAVGATIERVRLVVSGVTPRAHRA